MRAIEIVMTRAGAACSPVAAVGGCATTGTPVANGEEDEATAAAKNETAPKPPSDERDPGGQAAAGAGQEGAEGRAAEAVGQRQGRVRRRGQEVGDGQGGEDRHQPGRLQGRWRRTSRASPSRTLAAQAHFNAGTILEGCGDDKDAESEYQAALSANPAYGPALTNLGGLYYKQNNPTTAQVVVREGDRRRPDPRRRRPTPTSALILYQQGKQTGDRALYNEAISQAAPRARHRRRRRCRPTRFSRSSITPPPRTTSPSSIWRELVCKQAQRDVETTSTRRSTTRSASSSCARRTSRRAQGVREGGGARSEVRRGAPQHRRHRPVVAAVREGGAVVRGGAQARAEELRRDHRHGRGARAASRRSTRRRAGTRRPPSSTRKNCAVQYNLGVLYQDYKSDPANANLQHGQGSLRQVSRLRRQPTRRRSADAERRIKDIDDTFAAIEEQKKMEAELKEQQDEMEKQQKAMEEQQKAQEAAQPEEGRALRRQASCRREAAAPKSRLPKSLISKRLL